MFDKIRKKTRVFSFCWAAVMLLLVVFFFWMSDAVEDGGFIFIIMMAVMAALAAYLVYRGVACPNLKEIEAYCSSTGNKEFMLKKLEEFYKAAPPVNGLRIGNGYFISIKGMNIEFAELREILWVYLEVTKHSYNFIPTGKTYAVHIMLADGNSIAMGQKNKKRAEETMNYIATALPYIICGHTNEIARLYNGNRQEMIRIVEERRTQYFSQNMQS